VDNGACCVQVLATLPADTFRVVPAGSQLRIKRQQTDAYPLASFCTSTHNVDTKARLLRFPLGECDARRTQHDDGTVTYENQVRIKTVWAYRELTQVEIHIPSTPSSILSNIRQLFTVQCTVLDAAGVSDLAKSVRIQPAIVQVFITHPSLQLLNAKATNRTITNEPHNLNEILELTANAVFESPFAASKLGDSVKIQALPLNCWTSIAPELLFVENGLG
jgi:hypothetical protein